MMSSILQAAEAVTEQEVRPEEGQDGAMGGPGQAVRLVHAHSTGPQRPQGLATAVPAATRRHQDDAERAAEHADPLLHLAQLSRETLQRRK